MTDAVMPTLTARAFGGGKHTIRLAFTTLPGEELLHLVDVPREAQVVAPRELGERRLGNLRAQVSTQLDGHQRVVAAVEDQRGNADVAKQSADVGLRRHGEQLT